MNMKNNSSNPKQESHSLPVTFNDLSFTVQVECKIFLMELVINCLSNLSMFFPVLWIISERHNTVLYLYLHTNKPLPNYCPCPSPPSTLIVLIEGLKPNPSSYYTVSVSTPSDPFHVNSSSDLISSQSTDTVGSPI